MGRMTETQRDGEKGKRASGRRRQRKERKPRSRFGEGSQEHNVRQPDNEVSLSDDGPRTSNIDTNRCIAHTHPYTSIRYAYSGGQKFTTLRYPSNSN